MYLNTENMTAAKEAFDKYIEIDTNFKASLKKAKKVKMILDSLNIEETIQ